MYPEPSHASQIQAAPPAPTTPIPYPESFSLRLWQYVCLALAGVVLVAVAGYLSYDTYVRATSSSIPLSVSESSDEGGGYTVADFRLSATTIPAQDSGAVATLAQKYTVYALREALRNDAHVDRIVVHGWLPVRDEYGTITDTAVINVTYTKGTLKKINFDTVPLSTIWEIADAGTVLPRELWTR